MSIFCDPRLSSVARDFVDDDAFAAALAAEAPDPGELDAILAKAASKQPLSTAETARLLLVDDPAGRERIFAAARELKRTVYGNRIVLFAPLYVGSYCINDCRYCAFRRSHRAAVRTTLEPDELAHQVAALEQAGHKRLILVFGEHPRYDPAFISESCRKVYAVRTGHGEIRRVNINAAPLDHAGYRTVKEAGVGTYQVFQETYHRATYRRMHPAGTRKSDWDWRLDALARAMEAGQDDVGIGALFGLAPDWRHEVLGLVAHAIHLERELGCGPHTISFPRMRRAAGVDPGLITPVSDADFKRLVAILRLAVPYTGLICTAREPAALRRELLDFGVSQIDAGSRIDMGGYTAVGDAQVLEREQFELGDLRSLDTVMRELLSDGHLPSFCTACYRLGRTGEHFMEFAVPGFIKRYCTPNALTTLQEYLVDHASPETRAVGERLIAAELAAMPDSQRKRSTQDRLHRIGSDDERDLYV